MTTDTLATSIDTISTATALGMNVPAPAGTSVYIAYAEDQDDPDVVHVRGYHASEQSALNELLQYAFAVWNEEEDLAPWYESEWYTLEGEEYERVALAARATWINENTDAQIVDAFFGEGVWSVTELKIEKHHKAPFTRG